MRHAPVAVKRGGRHLPLKDVGHLVYGAVVLRRRLFRTLLKREAMEENRRDPHPAGCFAPGSAG